MRTLGQGACSPLNATALKTQPQAHHVHVAPSRLRRRWSACSYSAFYFAGEGSGCPIKSPSPIRVYDISFTRADYTM
ncbi:hypothetical protein BDA96_03G216300 [Sorghum bicolor]|uniref:Uncharacterized protein n=2 Tax=Sorghum bicolor TaxID=4558 RepID=A0A921RDU0_SORBI|nr:hypothetical protein BDA96_03G216300 [Sorghum bicolor]KXG30796.1 hypothetical protein SORBI_3004G244700 [Sorghum bicolor]